MSIAIVAMVNHSALPRDENIPIDFNECRLSGNSSENEVIAEVSNINLFSINFFLKWTIQKYTVF